MRTGFFISGVFFALFGGLFGELLLGDVFPGHFVERNFIYRDAGHFYYPYFQMIQSEWSEGRVPLWDIHENGGQPLAANPTASVFYPLKLLFLLPYPFAYRWYLMGHVLLAWLSCFAASRQFGMGRWGGSFAATSYAFSGFVLFQLYNIVFLVSAAWLPLALLAVDRVVRRPSWRWSLGLAMVLALQVLGGDPQIVLLVGLSTVPYFLFYHHGVRLGGLLLLACLALGFCFVQRSIWRNVLLWLTFGMGVETSQRELLIAGAAGFGLLLGLVVMWRARRRVLDRGAGRSSLSCLVIAGLFAGLLAAIQILPTLEFTSRTDRAAPEAPHEPVAFSLFPARVLELGFPSFFGKQFPVHGRWLAASAEGGIWIPTIYLGLATTVFALASISWRRGPATVRWLSYVTLFMFWLSLGKFGGPWWLFDRSQLGDLDPIHFSGSGLFGASDGLYWLCEQVVPGFRAFRYPSKILIFCTLGLSLLAGFGVERWRQGEWPGLGRWCARFAVGGLLVTIVLLLGKGMLVDRLATWVDPVTIFGPFDSEGAWRSLASSFLQFTVVSGLLAVVVGIGSSGPRRSWGPPSLLLLLAADLYVAHRGLILTDSQEVIDSRPSLLAVIEADQAKEDERAPFRVHRARIFNPPRWFRQGNDERVVEMTRWERNTLAPKYGVPFGVEYASVEGTMGLYDVEFFFAPWTIRTPPELRNVRGSSDQMVYYPRQGYNLWNTKYFVLPKFIELDHAERGVFTFLATAAGLPCPILAQSGDEDYLVLKNPEAFPRAWLVHEADFRPRIRGLDRADRLVPMEQLLFRDRDAGERLWQGKEYGEYPLRQVVMIETDHPEAFKEHATGGGNDPTERVRIEVHESNYVRLRVEARTAGFVVVSDAFFPGWAASVDGNPTEILLANRAMRAVPVSAGEHVIEMRYRSLPFEWGAAISGASWFVALLATVVGTMGGARSRGVPSP